MVVSNRFTSLLMLKSRCSSTHCLASVNSSLRFMTSMVSRLSIRVKPSPNLERLRVNSALRLNI